MRAVCRKRKRGEFGRHSARYGRAHPDRDSAGETRPRWQEMRLARSAQAPGNFLKGLSAAQGGGWVRSLDNRLGIFNRGFV